MPAMPTPSASRCAAESLGWNGRNLRMEVRWGNVDPERYRAYGAELIALACEVIVTQSNQVTTIVSQLTRTIPIIFAGASDPLETGLITNIARPGGNVTGFSQLEVAFVGKYMELLKEVVPGLARVAVLYTRNGPASAANLRKIGDLAPSIGLQITPIAADDSAELDRAIDAFSSGGQLATIPPRSASSAAHRPEHGRRMPAAPIRRRHVPRR